MFSLSHYPDLDNQIFDFLLTEDICVGDLNGHHLEWMSSSITNCHVVAAFDFATVSSCDQLVVSPTHAYSGTRDLIADVPDLVYRLLL